MAIIAQHDMGGDVISQVVDKTTTKNGLAPLPKTPKVLDVSEETFVLEEEDILLTDLLKSARRRTLPPICWDDAIWRDPEDSIKTPMRGRKRQDIMGCIAIYHGHITLKHFTLQHFTLKHFTLQHFTLLLK